MRWDGEEALAVPDLHDRSELDLFVGLARHDFEEIAVEPDGLGRNLAQLFPSHFVLLDWIVLPVDLDFVLFVASVRPTFVLSSRHRILLHGIGIVIPRYHGT